MELEVRFTGYYDGIVLNKTEDRERPTPKAHENSSLLWSLFSKGEVLASYQETLTPLILTAQFNGGTASLSLSVVNIWGLSFFVSFDCDIMFCFLSYTWTPNCTYSWWILSSEISFLFEVVILAAKFFIYGFWIAGYRNQYLQIKVCFFRWFDWLLNFFFLKFSLLEYEKKVILACFNQPRIGFGSFFSMYSLKKFSFHFSLW